MMSVGSRKFSTWSFKQISLSTMQRSQPMNGVVFGRKPLSCCRRRGLTLFWHDPSEKHVLTFQNHSQHYMFLDEHRLHLTEVKLVSRPDFVSYSATISACPLESASSCVSGNRLSTAVFCWTEVFNDLVGELKKKTKNNPEIKVS